MSHVVTSPVVVTDLECLAIAVSKIKGLHWCSNQKTFAWYGQWVNDYSASDAAYKLGIETSDYGKCEHAIKVDGSSYEIGIMKRKESAGGGYAIVWDFYGTGRNINKVIGDGAERLLVEYQRAFLQKFANVENMNLTMEESTDEITIEMELNL